MSEEKLSKHDIEKNKATHDFDMKGDLVLIRTITHDFDGHPIDKSMMYRCRYYSDLKQWLIEPKYGRKHEIPRLTRVVGIKKKS